MGPAVSPCNVRRSKSKISLLSALFEHASKEKSKKELQLVIYTLKLLNLKVNRIVIL